MRYNRLAFFNGVRGTIFGGHMTKSQVSGCDLILTGWEVLYPNGDPRWLAYALATAAWETAHTMQPIEEYAHGAGHFYGVPAGPYKQIYYGRGYVQLTLYTNYVNATAKLRTFGVLGAEEDMAKNPSLAMRPDVAVAILLHGMADGWFTGHKLGEYLTKDSSDWIDARKVVNGLDHAHEIAAYAKTFLAALEGEPVSPAKVEADPPPLQPVSATDPAVPSATPAASDSTGSDQVGPGLTWSHRVPHTTSPIPLPTTPTWPDQVPPIPAAPPAVNPTAVGDKAMDIISILMQLISGVAGKVGTASAIAAVAPRVVTGALNSISEAPTVIHDIEALITDIEDGKWKDVPNAVEEILSEFAKIVGNFGIKLPVLNQMVNDMTKPATTAGVTV